MTFGNFNSVMNRRRTARREREYRSRANSESAPRIRPDSYRGNSKAKSLRKWADREERKTILYVPILTVSMMITREWLKSNKPQTHHLVPQSRMRSLGFDDRDIDKVTNKRLHPVRDHRAWHYLFGNLMADEVIRAILDGWIPVTESEKQAWWMLFADRTGHEAISIIKKNWSLEYSDPVLWGKILDQRERFRQTKTLRKEGKKEIVIYY